MRMLIAGGGTGGHLFPGLALAEEVKTRHPRNEVLFVGTARGLETRIVPKNGFPLELIEVSPLKRQGTRGTLRGLFRLPRSVWQSSRIRRAFLDNYLRSKEPSGDRLSILVTGGSQGAHVLNLRVAEAMELLAPALGRRLRLLHQTGEKDSAEIARRYQALQGSGLEAQASPFIDDMASAYGQADLLVCRAGATTIAELT